MPNRLVHETSPYLLQHAENPVDWYPWGEEALARARTENKPIFLSIGYSACHWCHVMEHESFEDPVTADVMNEHFVNIKVDREERPDLDTIYMRAVVALTGRGGWPMSVWLTPDLTPFFGGTYFPNRPRGGMPAFTQVLEALAAAWQEKPADIARSAGQLAVHLKEELGPADALEQETEAPGVTRLDPAAARGRTLDPEALDVMTEGLLSPFDSRNGGWGGAPKFPQPMAVEFLLRRFVRTGSDQARHAAEYTLQKMSAGGMYDQLGGGFHRYSVDAVWLVPHFEKMLYDNSQLARAYLHAFQVTGNPLYRVISENTLDYVVREMTHPDGGFYSTQDADSEGEEGRFFLWSVEQVEDVLGDEAELFSKVFGVVPGGNFEGRSILHLARDPRDVAVELDLTEEEVRRSLSLSQQRLFAVREERVRPGRDEKVLTSWNGLMLAAFAEASRALGREDYRRAAERNAEFVLARLRTDEGRLHRTWKDGRARLAGYLEDYAFMTEGLLALYQATFEERWFVAARDLADQMLEHFAAPGGTFYDTADDHEELILRPQDLQDSATPSGNAMATTVLLKLGAFTGDDRYSAPAEEALRRVRSMLESYPLAFAQWLSAYDFAAGVPAAQAAKGVSPGEVPAAEQGPVEVALVGDPDAPDTMALLGAAFAGYHPERVVALKRPGAASAVPLLEGRDAVDGRATAYVCKGFACEAPTTDPEALAGQLA